ncbi:hypothetical protein N7537_000138 [Penicillium hordei]|uniref:Uncharacterized protein n=1 Tax=Penicillium hordei TaxID=40994 RepID=A0AAD6EE86_9EURO|nr:uncharacterized protein N7537_000138 [Penicillium hordei]KAJ5615024.1 hypothetical protein N7537_000138 [Penicillium hordei]
MLNGKIETCVEGKALVVDENSVREKPSVRVGDTVCWGDLAGDVDGMMTTESMEGPVVVREIAVLS